MTSHTINHDRLLDYSYIELKDLTTGSQLYSRKASGGLEPPANELFLLDCTHEYSLHMFIDTTAENDGPWSGYIQARVIPAPGAFLLGTIGVGFVGWLRRRRTL